MIYLIRHAQAGTRDNYDVLSETGETQARMLGRHFAAQGVELDEVWTGAMRRQQYTAELMCREIAQAGRAPKDVRSDQRWNEFSLASLYQELAGRMMSDSPDFACDFAEMQEALRRDPHTTRGATGRCDLAMIRAWIENRYSDYSGESWSAFRSRVESIIPSTSLDGSRRTIAVVTSATPIAILTAVALGLSDEKMLSVLGLLYNSGVTTMRIQNGGLRLFTLNATPHLPDSIRTFR